MQVIWGEEDIRPGRRVGKPGRNERWMIGYLADQHPAKMFVLISLVDGMTHPPLSKRGLALKLNESGELPVELLEENDG